MIINQASLQAIYNTFKVIFNQAFDAAPSMCDLVAMRVPSTGKTQGYPWLGNFPTMREWIGDRVIKDLSLFDFTIKNKKFESTVGVLGEDIEDDQIGVYTPVIQGLAQAAKNHPDILVFALLKAAFTTKCYDGQNFCDADHPWGDKLISNNGGGSGAPWFLMDLSRPIKPIILQIRKVPQFVAKDKPTDQEVFMRDQYIYGVDDRKNVGFGLWQCCYGSQDTLNAANYAAYRTAMMSFTREDNVTPLGIIPTHLVHGPTLEAAAKLVINAERNADGSSNIWYNTVKVVNVPWMI
jgi:phage major head subunit gpT-like protein